MRLTHPPLRGRRGLVGHVRPLWSFTGRYRVLHLTWFAFFLTFLVWFNYAPFASTIAADLGLTGEQQRTIALCNVALTVPARVFVGMALDRFGPRRVYGAILLFAAVPNTAFALASTFELLVLSRLALSVVGAGFVVGIRMVSEWFPPKELGTAEGVYGGWGNFGSAAAACCLPLAAAALGGGQAWRWAVLATGLAAALYGVRYMRAVTDTPDGVSYARPPRQGALEATSRRGVFLLAALHVPLAGALALVAWRVWRVGVISGAALAVALTAVAVLLVAQEAVLLRVNRPALAGAYPPADRYPMRSVAVLCFAYFATFGSELAVVSMLPAFFADTWGLGPGAAGVAASGFAFMNLGARPAGGLLSDLLGGRKRTLSALLVGLSVGYVLLSTMGAAWPWALAVAACMACSFFVQAGEGAVYAIVPLVNKRVSGQVAGMAGAYGNVGALTFLTVGLFLSTSAFFLAMAAVAAVATLASLLLVEPAGSFTGELHAERATPQRAAPASPSGRGVDAVPGASGPAAAEAVALS